MEHLWIYIPGAPMGWQRPDQARNGRRYAAPKTAAREREIGWAAKAVLSGREPFTGAVRVTVQAWMPIPQSWSKRKQQEALDGLILPTGKPDSDNILKLILDGLNGVVWKDDAAVTEATIRKRYAREPQTVICIERDGIQKARAA